MADFTNIDGVYAKDTELRSGIDTLRTTVLSNTIKPLTVTKNDTYTAIPSSGTYGYSPIIVDVQEEPWEPLEDGYSNFWFELTNDTLSPWLNFSAKNANATIDWGDGSGEQSLDTLTPTHTYSKAGRYIVKVKGVTGIAAQQTTPATRYAFTLKAVELNNEVSQVAGSAFLQCVSLENVDARYTAITGNNVFQHCANLRYVRFAPTQSIIGNSVLSFCSLLYSVELPSSLSSIGSSCFYYSRMLQSITLPSTITNLGSSSFSYCSSLTEIHVQAETPPSLGTNVFLGLSTEYIIYVPQGTGETYKSAAGWDAYADHIVEEGQTLSNAALRRIQAENSDNGEEMR